MADTTVDIEKIHPQLRQVIGRIPSVPIHNRVMLSVLKVAMRLAPYPKIVDGVIITEHRLHNAGVRVYRPEGTTSGAALLWIHGGGMIIGSAAMNDRECSVFAKELNIVVVSVEYRLAPKHTFPCATDDCFEAWQWLQSNADTLEIDPERIVVSGQSAGGGLAASLVQQVYDAGGIQPAGQALFCPMLDDRTAARIELDAIKHRIWNNTNNRGGWSWYLGHAVGEPELPNYAAPARRKDLSGLAEAWIGVGGVDLFCEEDTLYAERLREAGVNCELEIVEGAPHAFETFAPKAPITIDFMAANGRFLRRVLKL